MLQMARLRLKRSYANRKPTAFLVKETQKRVDDANIDRFLKRRNISDDSLLSMASPIDSESTIGGFASLTS